MTKRLRPTIAQIAITVAVCAAIVALGFWIAPMVTRERVELWVRSAGAWGPVVLIAVQIAQILIAPIPGVFVPLLAGFLYGPVVGGIATLAGTFVGSLIAYGIGRTAGRPLVTRWIGAAALDKAHALLAGRRWIALVPMFLFPFSPSDALCFAAGIVGLDPGPFAIAVLLGRAPKDLALALAGAGLLKLGG